VAGRILVLCAYGAGLYRIALNFIGLTDVVLAVRAPVNEQTWAREMAPDLGKHSTDIAMYRPGQAFIHRLGQLSPMVTPERPVILTGHHG